MFQFKKLFSSRSPVKNKIKGDYNPNLCLIIDLFAYITIMRLVMGGSAQ